MKEVGHAILRALEGVNCEELATVLDIRTGDGTSMKNEIEWNLEFCKNELRVIDQNRMNIGGPDYIDTRCPNLSCFSYDPGSSQHQLNVARG